MCKMSLSGGPEVWFPARIDAADALVCGAVCPGWTAAALRRGRGVTDALLVAAAPPDFGALAAWAAARGVRVTFGT